MNTQTPSNFVQGFFYLVAGYRHIFHPKIRHYVWIPLLINFFMFGGLFCLGFYFIWQKLSFLSLGKLPHFLQWASPLVSIIKFFIMTTIFTILLAVFAIVASFCANFIGAPFNGFLSEAYSHVLTGVKLPNRPSMQVVGNIMVRESLKILYCIPRALLIGILAAILYFLPPLNLLIPVLFYWFSAIMMNIQYLDYPADNHHVTFRQLLKLVKTQRAICLGFGFAIAIASSIPVPNFFVMPAAVLGATKLWHDKFINHNQKDRHSPS